MDGPFNPVQSGSCHGIFFHPALKSVPRIHPLTPTAIPCLRENHVQIGVEENTNGHCKKHTSPPNSRLKKKIKGDPAHFLMTGVENWFYEDHLPNARSDEAHAVTDL